MKGLASMEKLAPMEELVKKYPLIQKMARGEEVVWLNPGAGGAPSPEVSDADIADAAARLERFAPYIRRAFPETEAAGGIIESPLVDIAAMAERLSRGTVRGRLMLKRDDSLPVSGSIKARGGIYEVLCLAEKAALESGMLREGDDYAALDEDRFRELFAGRSLAVGSTGNLGLSVGIMGARLGFRVTVHMSADARQWKKDLLRRRGAEVVEYAGDYQAAVAEGRRLAEADPLCHFVDDENSRTLFLGYAVAAQRLKAQLERQGVSVDADHPLFVYLPCGVGGGPGGVAYGLKRLYGANVHCFFAEPVQAPCMLLGVMTGLHDGICVQDIGLTGRTAADGLAVGRPSKFVGRVAGPVLDGIFTVSDERLAGLIRDLHETEGIFVEPSAAAGLPGWVSVQERGDYAARFSGPALEGATHIVWATGGGMVPPEERRRYLEGKIFVPGAGPGGF